MVFDDSAVLLPMSSLDMGSRTARADKPTGPTARRQEKKIFRVRCEERAKEPHFEEVRYMLPWIEIWALKNDWTLKRTIMTKNARKTW